MAKVLKRSEIDDTYKWNLYDIIESEEAWEALYVETERRAPEIAEHKGKLVDSDSVYECMMLNDELGLMVEKLYVFASMKVHEDESVALYQGMRQRVEMLSVRMSEMSAYVVPEISKLSDETLEAMAMEERFEPFRYSIKELVRNKSRVLSEAEEKLLAGVGNFSGSFSDIFSLIDNVDIKFKPVTVDGEKVEMSHARYSGFMQNPDRNVRRRAFESMFGAYRDMINTISSVYVANVKKDVFYATVRRHASTLEAKLFGEDIAPEVYQNLIDSVHGALPTLHGYVDYRAKCLGVKRFRMYDMYVPIVKGVAKEYTYPDACKLVKEGLKPLGEEYGELLARAFGDRWIDVYENKGKRSGAYSWGVYGTHPYVLMNFEGNTHDVFTLAHELGHSMHTYYSNRQPHAASDYQIFVAEIASTVNEVLLLKHMLSVTTDVTERKYLLSYYLDMFRTTVFRQTQFAEFEKFSHETVEKGMPLGWENMSVEYLRLNKLYYGEQCDDDLIRYEWARIPHFYRSFYVYKYATGLISAVSIARGILDGKEGALSSYKAFLSAGGSMSPLDTLKLAGIDLTETEPFETAMKEFADTLEELRSIR